MKSANAAAVLSGLAVVATSTLPPWTTPVALAVALAIVSATASRTARTRLAPVMTALAVIAVVAAAASLA